MAARNSISFIRRGKIHTEAQFSPRETLLDYLRLREGDTSVKEGCREGDCGACTVALGCYENGRINYAAVNSCIYPMGMIDGKEIVTAKDISDASKELHPVQQAMVDAHGSQCGFCTPGFIMSLFAFWHNAKTGSRAEINDWLSGNLCRCTGYRPIIDAAYNAYTAKPDRDLKELWPGTGEALKILQIHDGKADCYIGDDKCFFAAPASLSEALKLYARHQDAILVSGATDVGLWITKKLDKIEKIIWLGRTRELLQIEQRDDAVTIGAGVTYENAAHALGGIHPDITRLLRRLGSRQVRASGTIGGNIANGSPIGDMPPILIALNANIDLASPAGTRTLALQDFFIRYGKQDIGENEILQSVNVPFLHENDLFACSKISKRFDQDISSVLGAIKLTLENSIIKDSRIAFGGMAETPKRARRTEHALNGISLSDNNQIDNATNALSRDFAPISDMRASAEYRLYAAAGFLRRSLNEFAGAALSETRIHDYEAQSS